MHKTISSPIGDLTLHVDDAGALTRIGFGGEEAPAQPDHAPGDAATLDAAAAQLRQYFAE